jgi:hypothetical protein
MICSTGATTASKASSLAVERTEGKSDSDDEQFPTRGEKQPKSSTALPLPSTEATTTSPRGLNVVVVFNTSDK